MSVTENRPDFPSLEEVEKATHEQLARWYRFLPSGETTEQQKIMERIEKRFKQMGGMTPEMSDKIGFGGSHSAGYNPKISAR